MKTIACVICFLSLVGLDLGEIRKNYPLANNDQKVAQKMHDALSGIPKDGKPIMLAYKGGISTIMAKHAKGIKDKKTFFKQGVALLEKAVEQENDNIEIRCIRMGVQENSPRFLKYKGQIAADKKFILESFSSESSEEIKAFVKGYILQSSSFSEAEKQLF